MLCICCLFTAKIQQKQTNRQNNNSKLCELSKPQKQKLIGVAVCSLIFLPLDWLFFHHHKGQSLSSYLVAPEGAFCAFSLASSQNSIPFLTSFCFSFFLSFFFPFFSNKIQMNVEETITIVTRMPSVQILLAPINASARQDIPVMA